MAVKEKKKASETVSEEKVSKKFEATYFVFAIIAVIIMFSVIVTLYFNKNYVMFSPDKVAKQYMLNVAGEDGYDAMKYTTLIKNSKFGDFISKNYMEQYKKEDENSEAPVLSAEEQGEKLTEILDGMMPVFTDLVETYGFENYDELFTQYFAKYYELHHSVYGHDFMTTDDMFAAFEGNLASYTSGFAYDRECVYGNGQEYAEKYLGSGKADLNDDDIYSAGYKINIDIASSTTFSDAEVKEYIDEIKSNPIKSASYERFGFSPDEIAAVQKVCVVKDITGNGDAQAIERKNEEYAEHPTQLMIVKIGSQWYVDISA